MKRRYRLVFVLALFAVQAFFHTACDSQAQAGTPRIYEIYLSPDLPAAAREKLKEEIQYFIAGDGRQCGMKTGDVLQIRNGSTGEPIGGEVIVREKDRKPRHRIEHAAPTINAMIDFLDSPKPTEGRSALNLAEFLSKRQTQPNTRILFIGSPIYYDDVESHDMRRGWLSDGYFNQPPQMTVFSIQGKQANLQNAQVSIATVGGKWGAGAEGNHRRGVGRFWAIFIQENGGTLVYFDDNVEEGLRSLTAENPAEVAIVPPRDKDDKTLVIRNEKIKILRQPEQQTVQVGGGLSLVVEATGPDDIKYQWYLNGEPIPGATQSTYKVPQVGPEHAGTYSVEINSATDTQTTSPVRIQVEQPTATPKPLPPITPDGPAPDWLTKPVEDYRRIYPEPAILPAKDYFMIGLKWPTDRNHNQDLDLHVRPLAGKDELSFRNTRTPEGVHYKDFKANPDANHGYEVVEILTPLSPESVEVWVNAYSGNDPAGFSGEVRLFYAGALRAFPFQVPAKSGNKGADAIRRKTAPHWIQINLSTQ